MSSSPSGSNPNPNPNPDPAPSQYWCNHCSKYSSTESLLGALICQDCRHRLPDFISAASPSPPPPETADVDPQADVDFANVEMDDEFFRIFHLIAEAGRGPNPPPSPPSPPSPPFVIGDPSQYDYLRLDLGGWDIEEEANQGNQESDDGDAAFQRRRRALLVRPVIEGSSSSSSRRRRRREADDLGGRRRHRVVRWADYFPDENAVEVRLQLPERDRYFGNPGDYVDADGYEAFLRVLAEVDNGGNRGSPPASKEAVLGLETGVLGVEKEVVVCVVCRELVKVGDLVKKLPCRHGYHGDCIVQWLKVRNSCPVCRFELPTDDPEYETERKKKLGGRADVVVDGSTSAASGGSDSGVVQGSYDTID